MEKPILDTDLTSAETIKIASNVFLAAKISFANEARAPVRGDGRRCARGRGWHGPRPAHRTGVPVSGPGFGGSCFLSQVRALPEMARSYGIETLLISSVNVSNMGQADWLIDGLEQARDASVAGARVAVLGLTFKANTDDLRESPALRLAERLVARGATVVAFDPVATERGVAQPRQQASSPRVRRPSRRPSPASTRSWWGPSGRSSGSSISGARAHHAGQGHRRRAQGGGRPGRHGSWPHGGHPGRVARSAAAKAQPIAVYRRGRHRRLGQPTMVAVPRSPVSAAEVARTRRPVDQASCCRLACSTTLEVLAFEQAAWFGTSWVFVAREEDVDRPGRFVTVEVAGCHWSWSAARTRSSARSTTCAAIAARSSARNPRAASSGSSARTTRGPTSSTGGCDGQAIRTRWWTSRPRTTGSCLRGRPSGRASCSRASMPTRPS